MSRKGGMAAGIEVARISVKVSPDTREFRRELKNQLDDIEQEANKKAKANLKVETKDAEQKVKQAGDRMSSNKIKLDADSKGLNASVEAMRKKLDTVDLAWEKKVAKFREENLRPRTNYAQIRSETNRIVQEFDIAFDKVRKSGENLEVALRPDLSRFDPRVIKAKLRGWFGKDKPLELPVEPSAAEGSKSGKDGFGALAVASKSAKKLPLPSFGSGINPAGYAVILAGILAVAAPLVGLITTALLTLPGLIGTLMAPIAAITLGLDGFKKAAEKIKPEFESLKKTMSAAAEDSFTPIMQRIADEIFPRLKESLPSVTQGLADMAAGALDAFKNDGGKFNASIERIGAAFTKMQPGIEGFTSGIIGLIDQFTLKLPGIADWFNKTGTDFAAWVKRVSESGELQTAFENLGKSIQTVLNWLGELAGNSIDFMGQKGAVDGFNATLKKIGDTITTVIDVSAKLNEKWQALVQVGRFVTAVTDVMQGNGEGAWSNIKDLWNNKPWNETTAAADSLKNSIGAAGDAAVANKAKIESFLAGGGGSFDNASIGGSAYSTGKASILESNGEAGGGAMPVPDTSAARAAVAEYLTYAESVVAQVKQTMTQLSLPENMPVPDFSRFRESFSQIPGIVRSGIEQAKAATTEQVNGMVQSFQTGGQQIVEVVRSWPGAVTVALASLGKAGLDAGKFLVDGLVAGISGGIPAVTAAARSLAAAAKSAANAELGIKSPSKVFTQIGNYTAQGFAKGMEDGFEPVMLQAKELAGKIANIFASGGDPTGQLEGFTTKEVTRMEKVLGFESKRLGLQAKGLDYQAKMAGKGPMADQLKAQADAIRLKKEELDLQKEMMALTREYGNTAEQTNPLADQIQQLFGMPLDFGKSVANQAMQDLGMSGNGFLPTLANTALDYGSKFIFNVSNMDDALSAQQTLTNRQSLGVL